MYVALRPAVGVLYVLICLACAVDEATFDERCIAACDRMRDCGYECSDYWVTECTEGTEGGGFDSFDWTASAACVVSSTECAEVFDRCLPCRSDADCGGGFRCARQFEYPTCYAACSVAEDCATGERCSGGFCLPF